MRILRTGGLKVESAALLLSGQQGGSIHVAVLPLLFPTGTGKVRVSIVLEIDGRTLLKGNTGDRVLVEVCLYALSAPAADGTGGGSVQGSLLETIEADLARIGAEVERSGLQYAGELLLPAGTYSLRVLVRNAVTGEVGLRILPLTVPDSAEGPLLLSPAFANPSGSSWVAALTKAARISPSALADGGLPAAQPVLGAGQEVRFELPVWKAGTVEALRVDVLRPDGGRVADLPAKNEARREDGGLARITASFVAAGLEPGRYLLRAAIPGTDAPAWATPFVLLAAGNEGKVWAELLHAGETPSRQAKAEQPPPAPPRAPRLKAAPLIAAYRKALHLLAAGDEPAARRAVSAADTPLLSGTKAAMPEDVAAIELGVAKDLAAKSPRSLLPLAVLHIALYRDAQEGTEHLVSTHEREMVFALADLYAGRNADDAGRRTAAQILLGLAAHLIRSAPAGLCERAFHQVLALDADNATALLYLAVNAERLGRYPEAVSHLERLLRAHPGHAEARLRLAVNLRRLGRPRDADALLAGLIGVPAETSEPWLLAIAYHETGRALLDGNRLDEAERTLRAGLKRLPGDEKLLLQLAEVFELRHDSPQARQVLAGFKPDREGPESARHRYTRLPQEALDQVWADLARSLPENLPSLAAALAPAPSRSGS